MTDVFRPAFRPDGRPIGGIMDVPPPHPGPDQPAAIRISATPFVYRDPKLIPPRQWLYGRHYVRSYVTATVAPGGLGKSSLCLVEAIAMVTGRPLLGIQAPHRLRVWVWNGEDPQEEIERRIAAILLHFRIPPTEIDGRLFVDSGRDTPIIIGEKINDRLIIANPVVDALEREVREKGVDLTIIDPFVSSHSVSENDNGAIDRVTKAFATVADRSKSAIELVHHLRKPGSAQAEFTIDDARGAVAMIGAVRSARVLNPMTAVEADKAQIPSEERKTYFRVGTGKSNMSPPVEHAVWRHLVSVPLDNETADDPGDWVGVVTSWKMPGVLEGVSADETRRVQDRIAQDEWAHHPAAGNWAGYAVGEVLGIDPDGEGGKQRIQSLIRAWLAGGALKIRRVRDTKKGRDKPMVVVGSRV